MNDSERASNKLYKILAPLIFYARYVYTVTECVSLVRFICSLTLFLFVHVSFIRNSPPTRFYLNSLFFFLYLSLSLALPFSQINFLFSLWYARGDLVMTAIKIRLYAICHMKYEAWSRFCRAHERADAFFSLSLFCLEFFLHSHWVYLFPFFVAVFSLTLL